MNHFISEDYYSNKSKNNFSDFGLDQKLLLTLHNSGYIKPTPIQEQAIPAIIAGNDIIGSSQTGTGKTAAFIIPIIQKLIIASNCSFSPAKHPIKALILTPTRELACQIYDKIKKYCNGIMIRSIVIFGGVDFDEQNKKLHSGCEILVATPGRLVDHLKSNNLNLNYLDFFVLDEADKMLDMGFSFHLNYIMQLLPTKRQNLLFSATFNESITKLSRSYLKNPVEIKLNHHNMVASTISQTIYITSDIKFRKEAILYLIKNMSYNKLILFANTKHNVFMLNRFLHDFGIHSDFIHSGKSQKERISTIERFKNGKCNVLVATDIASRGLDIEDIPCIINYEIPLNIEDYVHRVGRTGRAKILGESISFCSYEEKENISNIEAISEKNINIKSISSYEDFYKNFDQKNNLKFSEKCALLSKKIEHNSKVEQKIEENNVKDNLYINNIVKKLPILLRGF